MFEEQLTAQPPLLVRWFTTGEPVILGRWIFLRALGAVFLSAFYSLYFQVHGLIGPNGILPAGQYLAMAHRAVGGKAYWLAPTLLWINASDRALDALVWVGLTASVAIMINIAPRISIAIAAICFLSFIGAAQDFSSYQSDGMLLEAAFLSLFFAPRGLRPALARSQPPTRASTWLLRWEWFRIYFESGLVKLMSGEPQWRNLTAMDKYYENGPLPTWLGWHVQNWPHAFHAASTAVTLIVELFVVGLIFFGPWPRLIAFLITTPLQIGIILTANYAFLNYLVLFLGVLLVEDRFFGPNGAPAPTPARPSLMQAFILPIHFITTSMMFLFPLFPTAYLLQPTRIANNFGLFAVMTRARYEIEFQGTADGEHWVAYLFRYKPQDPMKAPGIYAPYQPRFEWNLWFASLGTVEDNPWVMNTQARLLQNAPAVLRLFARNPFAAHPPAAVRAMQWQYRFTTPAEHKQTGAWWHRELLGAYAPTAMRAPDGRIAFESEP